MAVNNCTLLTEDFEGPDETGADTTPYRVPEAVATQKNNNTAQAVCSHVAIVTVVAGSQPVRPNNKSRTNSFFLKPQDYNTPFW